MTTNEQRVAKTLGYLGYGTGSFRPFDQVFAHGKPVTPEDVSNGACDAVVIWGGEDIATSLYGEEGGVWTGADRYLSKRDTIERDACNAAIAKGIPIIGVCRGAQLLCAMAGGKLVQHVEGHNRGDHDVTTSDGRTIITTSYHHQMMWPYDVEHEMLAVSSKKRSRIYAFNASNVKNSISKDEPEVVWFPKIKGLAIQGHPEFMDDTDEFVGYCNELVRRYCL